MRPGGFVLVSIPNRSSLDLHLSRHTYVRAIEFVLAGCCKTVDACADAVYRNFRPDPDGGVYPDCDMISSFCPGACRRFLEAAGCDVDFVDSTYMCAHRHGSNTGLKYQKNTARPWVRDFGDHLLILAHKRTAAPR